MESLDISLRPLNLADVDAFMVWATDEKAAKFCSWEPYTSKQEAINYLANKVLPHPYFKAICLDKVPIGAISVEPNTGLDISRAELGYVIGSKYWGKGIVTKAVEMVAKDVFNEWSHLVRLEALVDVENLGSQKVLMKAGFIKEGVLRKYIVLKGTSRDMVMFSLLSTDLKN